MARQISEFEQHLDTLVKPLRTARWSADYRWDGLERALIGLGEDYGGLELIPDFQRGHVWTPEQQAHYIENCLRGVVPVSGLLIQFNSPSWSDVTKADTDLPPGLQCVDGLQRFTAITEFVKGNVKPFGYSAKELLSTAYSPRKFYVKVAVYDFTSREQLLTQYLDLNAGGTPHSAAEIERVRGLLAEAQAKAEKN